MVSEPTWSPKKKTRKGAKTVNGTRLLRRIVASKQPTSDHILGGYELLSTLPRTAASALLQYVFWKLITVPERKSSRLELSYRVQKRPTLFFLVKKPSWYSFDMEKRNSKDIFDHSLQIW